MKNPLTPETYRFVAQHLNHCATAVPAVIKYWTEFIIIIIIIIIIIRAKRGTKDSEPNGNRYSQSSICS